MVRTRYESEFSCTAQPHGNVRDLCTLQRLRGQTPRDAKAAFSFVAGRTFLWDVARHGMRISYRCTVRDGVCVRNRGLGAARA